MKKTEDYFHLKTAMSENGKRLFFDDKACLIGEFDLNPVRFEVGKAYQHHSGSQIYICGKTNTLAYGSCLMAENGWNKHLLKIRQEEMLKDHKENGSPLPNGSINSIRFSPVGTHNGATDNFFEIPTAEFYLNNFEQIINKK